jgi:hypothetical protein
MTRRTRQADAQGLIRRAGVKKLGFIGNERYASF